MNFPIKIRQWMNAIVSPSMDAAMESILLKRRDQVPTVWLLGKTGAGKSSIIQRLTGDSRSQIGNGFEPCTKFSRKYQFPSAEPLVTFLDTRGLGEIDYDPLEDLAEFKQSSQALLIVVRVDDPEQSVLIDAIKTLGQSRHRPPALVVHTALHTISNPHDLQRAIQYNQQEIEAAYGKAITSVAVDFTSPEDGIIPPTKGLNELTDVLSELIPSLYPILSHQTASSEEQAIFLTRRVEILGYASATGAIDLIPAVGLIAVPSIQGKMLHSLALRYSVPWDSKIAKEFLAALGTSFLYRYAISLMARQVTKFIPIYGQTAGAATAASISFASTYALGRVASLYFYKRQHGHPINTTELQSLFKHAFSTTTASSRNSKLLIKDTVSDSKQQDPNQYPRNREQDPVQNQNQNQNQNQQEEKKPDQDQEKNQDQERVQENNPEQQSQPRKRNQ